MTGVWGSLLPLVIATAVVPVQIVIVILLLTSVTGPFAGVAWVAGVTTMRLLQGLLFGLMVAQQVQATPIRSALRPSEVTATLLFVLGLLLLVMAGRQAAHHPDEDVPPKWLERTRTLPPSRAYLFGALSLAISAKFWVFTLGAIAAISDADLGKGSATVTYLLFVALSQAMQIAAIAIAYAVPDRAVAILTPISTWLTTHNRLIVIVIGVVFGTWFVLKGLNGLGVL